ncbi:MAG: substrate-binding domain-containing protein, partial [bacterium]|nr:substrate-binding domain-containing protein [bacterium]
TIHEFWKSVHAGSIKASRELDVEIIWKAPLKEDDREAQIAVMEDMIARGVSGIVLTPLDDMALRMPVANANRAGIPVVVTDSGLKGKDFVSYVATDNFEAGRTAARHMGKLLHGKGKVAVLRYSEGHDSTTKREDGFLKGIAEFEGIEVVSSDQYAGVTTESAVKAAENLFLRFGGGTEKLEIGGIFCATEPTTLGILRALKNMGADG